MSSESLSQGEIDLLFTEGGDDVEEVAGDRRDPEIRLYDFQRPARISKDRKRTLEAIYELVAKSLEGWLAGRIRDSVDLELESVEQLSFGEFMLALPSPCASYVMDIRGTGGQEAVIDFGHDFAFFLVDRLLGGAGRVTVPDRSLTPTEQRLVRIMGEEVVQQLMEAWQDYVSLDLEIKGFESVPEMLQVANQEDPMLVAHLSVTMEERTSVLLLCLPFTVLEKFFSGDPTRRIRLSHENPEERERERRWVRASVRDARLNVAARLPSFHVSMKELTELEPGAVLGTGFAPGTPLEIHVAGQRRFSGQPGRRGQKLAVKVEERLEPEPEHSIGPAREEFTLE